MKALDREIFRLINSTSLANGFFDFLAVAIDKGFSIFLMLVLLALLFSRSARCRRAAVVLFAGDIAGIFLLEWLKNSFHRLRPGFALADVRVLAERTNFSFPSGHSCEAFMSAVFLTALFGRKAGVWLFAAAALVGLSRIYCGVHYPADVLAGAVIGSAYGYMLVLILRKFQPKNAET